MTLPLFEDKNIDVPLSGIFLYILSAYLSDGKTTKW
jgi:hypothetical protein